MGLSMPGRRRGVSAERLGHRGIGEPLIAPVHQIALLRGEALALEQGLRDIACLGGEALCAARLREPCQRVDQRPADALPREFGSDEQHGDLVGAFEAGEASDCAVDHGQQGQRLGESGAESLFIVGARRPGLTLVLVIIFRRQLLDARTKDISAAARVGRQIGTKGNGAHRLSSQVVAPSLLSLMATPSSARRSRSRSDSAQFLAARAAERSATIASILYGSRRASVKPQPSRSDFVCRNRPRRLALAFRISGESVRLVSEGSKITVPGPPGCARRCSLAMAAGVLRSSAKASRTSSSGSPLASTSPTASYHRSSGASAFSSAFTLQS